MREVCSSSGSLTEDTGFSALADDRKAMGGWGPVRRTLTGLSLTAPTFLP